MNPKFPKNSFENFGKGYIPNQNLGTFLKNYLVSEFKTIFNLNLKIYSNIYGYVFKCSMIIYVHLEMSNEQHKLYLEDIWHCFDLS